MIDQLPAVGRYLFVDSILRDGFWKRAGRITRIAGKRIYYNDHHDSSTPNERYVHEKTVMAVCDTAEEAARLVAFNRRALDEVQALKESHARQVAGILNGAICGKKGRRSQTFNGHIGEAE